MILFGEFARHPGPVPEALGLVAKGRDVLHDQLDVATARRVQEITPREQVARYLETAGLDEGWLVLFDLRQGVPWVDKLTIRERAHAGKRVRIVGC